MPHRSLEFSNIGPVAAHAQWNEAQDNCVLRIFARRQDADAFLPTIPASERQGFEACTAILENGGDAPNMLEINGDTALSLTSFLVKLSQTEGITFGEPDLVGFWEPPANRALGAGMMMWFHPDAGYHIAITHSKEQAETVIHGLSWLETERRHRLLGRINKWNTPRRSDHPVQKIEGIIAEVLCKASFATKVAIEMDAHAATAWN